MNAPTHICPSCRTEYFKLLVECDWCPGQAVVPVQPAEASAPAQQKAA